MARVPAQVISSTRTSALSTNRVLRNTYLLLGATLGFSALTAGLAMALNLPHPGIIITLVGYFGLLFAVTKTQESAWGLFWVFALTGFMGLTLGPIINAYLTMLPNGGQVVTTALAVTAGTFVGLSAYAIKSERDFSFLGGLPHRRHHRRVPARARRLLLQDADLVAGGIGHVRPGDGRPDPVPDERDHSWRRDELHFSHGDALRLHLQPVHQPAAPLRGDVGRVGQEIG